VTDPGSPDHLSRAYQRGPGDLRIGNAEREQAVAELRQHASAGRLDVTEFDERVGLAYRAQTANDLRNVFHDLPRLPPVEAVAKTGRPWLLSNGLVQWIGISLLVVFIWAASGFGYFWPIWVIGPIGIITVMNELKQHTRPPQEPPPHDGQTLPPGGWSDRI
jgi:hypothetical protein